MSKNSAVNLVISDGPNIPTVQVPSVDGTAARAGRSSSSRRPTSRYTVKYTTSNTAERHGAQPEPGRRRQGQGERAGRPDGVGHPDLGVGAERARASRPQRRLTALAAPASPSGARRAPAPASSRRARLGAEPGGRGQCAAQHAREPGHLDRPCASVPSVVGQTAARRRIAITGAGLVANTTFDTSCANNAQPGNVDSQNPRPAPRSATAAPSTSRSASPTTTTTSSSSTTTTHDVDEWQSAIATAAKRRGRPAATTPQARGGRRRLLRR